MQAIRRTNPSLAMVGVAACALLLSSCSTARLGYDWLPALTLWQLDRYLGLDERQQQQTKSRLEAVVDWHRRNELPGYATFLTATADRLDDNATLDTAIFEDWRGRAHTAWLALVPQIAPVLAELGLSLRSSQIDRLEQRLAERTAELHAEYLPADSGAREEVRLARWEARTESILGEISDRQRQTLQRLARETPAFERLWLSERERRVEALLRLLRRTEEERPSPALARAWWEDYLTSVWRSPNPERQARLEEANRHADSISLHMINQASRGQRAHLLQKIRAYISDFTLLAAG